MQDYRSRASCSPPGHIEPRQYGSLFRNAAAFGVDAVLMDSMIAIRCTGKAIRVSVGVVLRCPSRARYSGGPWSDVFRRRFSSLGLVPRARRHHRIRGAAHRIAGRHRGRGLPEAILRKFARARIPATARLDSLNVAMAAGIALHQVASINGRVLSGTASVSAHRCGCCRASPA
ncbi:hypothetical protein F2981_02760 [Sinorhizobium meliloti]|nr:hypothetical protein [Sinorhizobium meliloti]